MSTKDRDFSRLSIHKKAIMHLKDQNVEGDVKNLSLKGAFIAVRCQLGLNDMVTFTISDIARCLRAKVVRVTDKGVGLRFEKTLLD